MSETNRPTPETDATLEQDAYWGDMQPTKETVAVARKLERQRDAARAEASRLLALCTNVHDRLLRGDDDPVLLEMLAESWKVRRDVGIPCQACGGSGAMPIHVCHGDEDVCRRRCPEPDPCWECKGTGFIDPNFTRNDKLRLDPATGQLSMADGNDVAAYLQTYLASGVMGKLDEQGLMPVNLLTQEEFALYVKQYKHYKFISELSMCS
jgi:hypothetical protein